MASIAFALILGSAIAGTIVNARLPRHHLSDESKDIIRVATGLVATLTALVLALLFASTRASFEQTTGYIGRLAADFSELDDLLSQYGPEAAPVRAQLRKEVSPLIDSIWREDAIKSGKQDADLRFPRPATSYMVRDLKPQNAVQISLQAQAMRLSSDMAQIRLALNSQPSDSMSKPFMTVVVLWLMFIFATFSMLAKPNPTLTSILCICILSACAAIYLILEMELPFEGLMQVPKQPLHHALQPL